MAAREKGENTYLGFEKEVLDKLDLIIRLLSLSIVKDDELRDQVKKLSAMGFRPKEIAYFLGKTPNHIRVLLSKSRKREQKVKTSD